ncbi:AbrB/MazE/SpoVT family DNA-binding domain-containing protein [Candidatus Saccharibacteria bacterium oral taxon 488]|nr:AbrB/MazE/SpoVT family DNA-binding domain-containing protein [Candidatus Saccharibacteria bacterium oral taxon 488]
MTITTIQKVIKIGSSRGVTLPARDLRALGIRDGDEVRLTVEQVKSIEQADKLLLSQEYDDFKKQYGETLKNLADR